MDAPRPRASVEPPAQTWGAIQSTATTLARLGYSTDRLITAGVTVLVINRWERDMAGIDWALIREGCPRCGAQRGGSRGLHWHTLSVWCLGCGWSKNWRPGH
jgi:hypothetical protein